MEQITLHAIMHRGAAQILVQCSNSKELNIIIRRLKGIKWSQAHKSWYLPLSPENYQAITEALQQVAVVGRIDTAVHGKMIVEGE